MQCCCAGQQSVILPLHDRIAFTGSRLQAAPIEDCDSAAVAMNESGFLQLTGRLRHTLAAYAEHIGD